MVKFFSICFFLLPWVMIPNDQLADPFRLPKSTFYDFICMGIICFSFYHGLKKRYFNKYLSWLIIWLFFIIAINWYLPFTLSFNNLQAINLWILEPMLHLILTLWASYIALSYFEKEDFEKITKVICWSAVLLCSVGLLQIFGFDIFGKIAKYNHGNRFCAFLDNPNILSGYIALSVPFFLIQKNKKYLIGFLIILLGILMAKSQMAIAVSIIGLLTYFLLLLRKNRKIYWGLISIMSLGIIGILVKFQWLIEKFGSYRWQVWQQAWVKFKDNPIFGQGIGIYKTWDLKTAGNTPSTMLHNDWFEIAIQIGIVGLILLTLIIINSFKKFNYKQDNLIGFSYYASFISFMVLMFGSFPLEIAPLALFGLTNWWAVETL